MAFCAVACTDISAYTVTFDTNGLVKIEAQTVLYKETAAQPEDPSVEGYIFEGWFVGESEYDFATPVTQNVTVSAKFTQIKYNVVIDYAGKGENQSLTIAHNGLVEQPEDPSVEGFEFVGWFVGENEYDFATPVKSDLTIVAAFDAITYQIVINVNDEQNTQINAEINHKATVNKPEDPARKGFIFIGWFVGENEYDFTAPVTSDLEIDAVWEEEVTMNKVVGAWAGVEAMMGMELAAYNIVIFADGTGSGSQVMSGYEMPMDITGFSVENNRLVMSYNDDYGYPATHEFKYENGKLVGIGITGGSYATVEMSEKDINAEEIVGVYEGSEDYSGMAIPYSVIVNEDGTISATIVFGSVADLDVVEISNKLVLSYYGMNFVLACDGEKFVGVGAMGGALVLNKKVVVPSEEITMEDIAGTWTGAESAYGMETVYTIVINADGTGSVSYDMGFGATELLSVSFAVESGNLIVSYKNYGYDDEEFSKMVFEYNEGSLIGTGVMGGVIALTKV